MTANQTGIDRNISRRTVLAGAGARGGGTRPGRRSRAIGRGIVGWASH